MCVRVLVLVLALGLTATRLAGAQTVPPKPDFSPMRYFVGSWTCTHLKNPDPVLINTTFAFTGAMDPGGYWELLAFRAGQLNITYDSRTKQWVFVYLGNGGDYGLLTTDGWHGNTLTLKDVVNAGGEPLGSATFTKLSNSQYRAAYTVKTSKGIDRYENVCRKAQ